MAQTFRTNVIPLVKRSVRETDRVYSVFSDDHGKLELFAKGSRKIVSKLAGEMETPGVLDVFVVRGRAFDRLAGAAKIATFDRILDSYEKRLAYLSAAAYIDRAVRPAWRDQEIFNLLREYLTALSDSSPNALSDGRLLFGFEWKLFSRLGFRPELTRCTRCRLLVGAAASFTIRHGGVLCPDCRDAGAALDAAIISPEARKVLAFLIEAPLCDSARLYLAPAVRAATRAITSAWSQTHLEIEAIS
jgi:DNA repair protein RecO (recombination protein O)